jgi:hypothetical protein
MTYTNIKTTNNVRKNPTVISIGRRILVVVFIATTVIERENLDAFDNTVPINSFPYDPFES